MLGLDGSLVFLVSGSITFDRNYELSLLSSNSKFLEYAPLYTKSQNNSLNFDYLILESIILYVDNTRNI